MKKIFLIFWFYNQIFIFHNSSPPNKAATNEYNIGGKCKLGTVVKIIEPNLISLGLEVSYIMATKLG